MLGLPQMPPLWSAAQIVVSSEVGARSLPLPLKVGGLCAVMCDSLNELNCAGLGLIGASVLPRPGKSSAGLRAGVVHRLSTGGLQASPKCMRLLWLFLVMLCSFQRAAVLTVPSWFVSGLYCSFASGAAVILPWVVRFALHTKNIRVRK